MKYFAVIDTETNWADQVMSIGTVIANADTFAPLESKYHILPMECEIGGMYYDTLFLDTPVKPILCTREEALADLGLTRREANEFMVYWLPMMEPNPYNL